MRVEEKEVCESASPACRSAERLAWRSEGGETQAVANSVVADWQDAFDSVRVTGSSAARRPSAAVSQLSLAVTPRLLSRRTVAYISASN